MWAVRDIASSTDVPEPHALMLFSLGLCAQVLRDFATRDLHRPWLAEIREALSACTYLEAQRLLVIRLLDDVAMPELIRKVSTIE